MKEIKIPIYNMVLYVLVGNSEESANLINETHTDNLEKVSAASDERGFTWHSEYKKGKDTFKRFYVSFEEKEIGYDKTTIEHEVLHLSWFMLDYVGVKISPKNHEAQTYLYEYLLKQIRLEITKEK
jgi:hypothetical protein